MARAYRAVDEENISLSSELVLLHQVDRFGTQSVFGRTLAHREIVNMNIAEAVKAAYLSRERSDSWAGWAKENEDMNRLLVKAMRAANE